MDEEHLNIVGAERFGRLFSAFITGKISPDKLFYKTLADKLRAEKPKGYGFAGLRTDSVRGMRTGYVISNRDQGLEYRIEVQINSEEGKTRVTQDFSTNKKFELPV